MKKTLCILCLLLAFVCVFAACDNAETPSGGDNTPNTEQNGGGDQNITHTHAYGEWSASKAATCTAKGEEKRACSCGESEVREIAATGEHSYDLWEQTVAPSCIVAGEKIGTCFCGATKTSIVEKLEHTSFSTVEENRVEPTCINQGSYEMAVYCECGKEMSRTQYAIALTEHKAMIHHEAINKTCTSNGNIEYWECTECQKMFYDSLGRNTVVDINSIVVLSSHENIRIEKIDATCENAGVIEHYHCIYCDKKFDFSGNELLNVSISKLQHVWENKTITYQPTCTSNGLEKYICSICEKENLVIISSLSHDYSITTILQAATCANEGISLLTCSICGTSTYQALPKAEHMYSSVWTVDKEATCISSGSKSRHCQNCSDKIDETIIEETGHNVVIDAAVLATCNKTGLTEGSHCDVCNLTVIEQEELPKTSHSYGSWITSQKATSNETGTKYRNCSICGTKETQTIPKISAVKVSTKISYPRGESQAAEAKSIQYVVKESSTYSGKYDVTITFQLFIHNSNGGTVIVTFDDQQRKYYDVRGNSGSVKSITFYNVSAGNYTAEFRCYIGYVT